VPELPELDPPASFVVPELPEDDVVDPELEPDDDVLSLVDPLDDVDELGGAGFVCEVCDAGAWDGDDDSLEHAKTKMAIAADQGNTYVFMPAEPRPVLNPASIRKIQNCQI